MVIHHDSWVRHFYPWPMNQSLGAKRDPVGQGLQRSKKRSRGDSQRRVEKRQAFRIRFW